MSFDMNIKTGGTLLYKYFNRVSCLHGLNFAVDPTLYYKTVQMRYSVVCWVLANCLKVLIITISEYSSLMSQRSLRSWLCDSDCF